MSRIKTKSEEEQLEDYRGLIEETEKERYYSSVQISKVVS